MAAVVYRISNSGTNTSYSAGSTVGTSWDTESNNFNLSVLDEILKQANGHLEDGDEIIFKDDPTFATITYYDIASYIQLDNNATITVTLKSRSGDADYCLLRSTLNTGFNSYIFEIFNSTDTSEPIYIFEDLGFTKSVTHIDDGNYPALIKTRNYGGDLTFTRCKFKDVTIVNAETSTTLGSLIAHTAGQNARNVIYTDCVVSGISCTTSSKAVLLVATTNNHLVINDMTVDDVTIVSIGAVQGLITIDDGGATIDGIIATNITITGNGTDVVAGGIIYQPLGGGTAFSVANVHVDGVTITGAEADCNAPCVSASGTGALTMSNCSITNASNTSVGNSVGCLVFIGQDQTGTISDCSSTNNYGFYGAGCYTGLNGSATVKQVACSGNDGGTAGLGNGGNPIDGVDFYAGGTGGVTYIACSSTGTNADSSADSVSVMAIINTAGVDRDDVDKTVTYQNCSFTAPVQTGVPVARFTASNATTNDLTVQITNCEIDGAAANNIELTATIGATTLLNLTSDNSKLGTIGESTPFYGTTTQGTDVTTIVGTGQRWWGSAANPVGSDGEVFTDIDTDVGSIQTTVSPFHPVNL